MKRFLVFVVIICMAFLLSAGAQEVVEPEEIKEEVQEETLAQPVEMPKPVVEMPITRLNVILIDEMNDQFINLENCVVQVLGELHIVEDSFNYTNTFVEGDRYEITIHVKLKK